MKFAACDWSLLAPAALCPTIEFQFLVVLIFITNFSQDRTRDERPVPGGWIRDGRQEPNEKSSAIEDFFKKAIALFQENGYILFVRRR